MRFRKMFVVLVGLLIVAAPSFAGIGIHLNYDMTKIDAATKTFNFANDPANMPVSSLNRDASSNPVGLGFDLSFGMLPIIDLNLSLDMAYASYDVSFQPPAISGQPGVDKTIPYLRAGVDLSATANVLGFPPVVKVVKVFVGGGLSVVAQAPVVSEQLLKDNIKSATEPVKPQDYVSANAKFGVHLMGGVTIKPPAFPLGVRVYGKYYIISGVDAPAPSNWLTVSAGIFFGL